MERRKKYLYGFMYIAMPQNSHFNVDRTSNTPRELVLILGFSLSLVPSWASQ